MQKNDMVRFVSGCLRARKYAEKLFPKDSVRRVATKAFTYQLDGRFDSAASDVIFV